MDKFINRTIGASLMVAYFSGFLSLMPRGPNLWIVCILSGLICCIFAKIGAVIDRRREEAGEASCQFSTD